MKTFFYKWLKKPFFGRFNKTWRWPDDIEQADWRRLYFKSQSGSEICALLGESQANLDQAEAVTSSMQTEVNTSVQTAVESPNQSAKGAVLLCHPMGVSAKGFWLRYGHASLLRQAGYHVMVFDFNGFGESHSTNMEFPLDVLAAGDALATEYPDLPIALIGASLGGAMSVCAMSNPQHPFKAAVIESAFPTLLHFWKQYPIPKLALHLIQLIYPQGEKRVRPIHAAKSLKGQPNMLLIYGEADQYTPVKHGKILFEALKNQTATEFWAVEGAKHTHAYAAKPNEYKERVLSFLETSLKSVP